LSSGFEVFGRERHALKIGDTYVDEDYMVYEIRRRPQSASNRKTLSIRSDNLAR
jgi:hypothetical protein